jgi:methionyl-tRNA formyltransferase
MDAAIAGSPRQGSWRPAGARLAVRVAALGRTRILLDTIYDLTASGHSIALIATCPPGPEADVGPKDFERLASDLSADFIEARSLDDPDIVARLAAAAADIAVSVNWLTRIGSDARATFRHGILNAHGGDLPRYRGNAPFAWAILNGEQAAGITIHVMDDGLDTGPVYRKRLIPITPDTYIGDLYRELANAVPTMFVEVVAEIERGQRPSPQTGPSLRGYSRQPSDAAMDWRCSAEHLSRLVRASAEPFGGAFTKLGDHRLVIWRARTVDWAEAFAAAHGQVLARDASGAVAIATGEGVLQLTQVQVADGPRVPPASIIRSLRTRIG